MTNKISSNNSNPNSLVYYPEKEEVSGKDKINSVVLEIISNSEVGVYQEKKKEDVRDDKILNLSAESNDKCIFFQKEDVLKKQNSFNSICRNVIDNKKVNKIIKSLPNGAEKALLFFLEQGKWDEIAKWDRNVLAYQAYDLFRQGKILYTQFSTCMFFYTLSKNIFTIPLFVDGKDNPVAFNLLCEGLGTGNWEFVDEAIIRDVFERMRSAPESEQYFFFCYDKFSEKNNNKNVCSRLKQIDFNFLNEGSVTLEVSLKSMIASETKKMKFHERMLDGVIECGRKLRNTNKENEEKLKKINFEIELAEKKLEILKVNKEKNPLLEDFKKIYLEQINKINLLKYNHEKLFSFARDVKIEIDNKNKEILFLGEEINKSKIQLSQLEMQWKKGQTVEVECKGRIVPSLSMMQAFVNVFGKENAITFTPVIGVSTIEDIKNNGKWGTRDIALAFPGIELPKEADGYFIRTPFDFSYHDFYHGCSASLASNDVRFTCIRITEMIDLKNNQELKIAEYPDLVNFFVEILIDMEMSNYLPDALDRNVKGQDRKTVQMLMHLDSVMSRALRLYKTRNRENFKKIKFKTDEIAEELVHFLIKNEVLAPSVSLDTRILVNRVFSQRKLRLFTQKYMEML